MYEPIIQLTDKSAAYLIDSSVCLLLSSKTLTFQHLHNDLVMQQTDQTDPE